MLAESGGLIVATGVGPPAHLPTMAGPQAALTHPALAHIPAQLADIAAAQPDATVELTLAPEELGRVRMTMAQEGDVIRVTLHAERPDTLDLLRRHADQLGQEFRQAGFAAATFTFGQWAERAPPPPEPPLPQDSAALPPTPFSRSPVPLTAQAGLDLRL